MNPPIRIAITPGEPSGVGPELTLKLAQKPLPFEIVAIANINLLDYISKQLNLNIELNQFDSNNCSHSHLPGQLSVIDVAIPKKVSLGTLDVENAEYVINTLAAAVDLVSDKTLNAITNANVTAQVTNRPSASDWPKANHAANSRLATRAITPTSASTAVAINVRRKKARSRPRWRGCAGISTCRSAGQQERTRRLLRRPIARR